MAITTVTPTAAVEIAANYFVFGLHALRQAFLASAAPNGEQAALLALSITRVELTLDGIPDASEPGDMARLGILDILGRCELKQPSHRVPHCFYRVTTPDAVVTDIPIFYYPSDGLFGTDETPHHGFRTAFAAHVAASVVGGIPPGGDLLGAVRA